MPRRSSRPSLYELGRSSLGHDGPVESPAGLTPGMSVRVPVGVLVLVTVVGVLVVVMAWFIGYGAGEEAGRRMGLEQRPLPIATDPLTAAAVVVQDPEDHPEDQVPGHAQGQAPEHAQATPAGGDPRAEDLWYFVLAETRPDGARTLADFCRAQGLEVVVVPGHNARLARVIALPGLASASSADPAYQALDARIRDVGRRWKHSGNQSDLADRYLDRK